ncbi:hypothetical protein [Pseudoroseicyclus tamaricis]|uniref:Uncharacterized protein n=1 Tax=Pseudoroseicyclus tamaricis TaxID=2705421 RepID=A0A6B2JLA4_9RHOB|nr:hypothetical protein [Pseudoroseicyclus tamaricis]NDU99396.1 hypothetical protein [Pseudoroseicyclus tamaricis]
MARGKQLGRRLARAVAAGWMVMAGAAAAQQEPREGREVSSDLDGDGVAETFTLRLTEENIALLDVTEGDAPVRTFYDVAWSGASPGTLPSLELAPNGSLRILSANESIGRERWRLALTIAYRDGHYRVAGITYDWYDTLDLSAGGTCDVNLLTGSGTVEIGPQRGEITALGGAPRLMDWRAEAGREGAICGLW